MFNMSVTTLIMYSMATLLFIAAVVIVVLYVKNYNLREDITVKSEVYQEEIERLSERSAKIDATNSELRRTNTELKDSFDKRLEERINAERENIEKTLEKEYEEALEEQKENLEKQVKEVDELLGRRIREIATTNTLTFRCSCDKNRLIPVEIDFSKENRFTCDNCGSVYRVEINSYPVLLSNVSTNKTLANMFEKK